MKYLVLVVLITTASFSLFGAEPSAFGAGDLDAEKPYGLTETEKAILQNKKNLKKIELRTNNQSDRLESIVERLDGLQTVVEGLGKKSHQQKLEIKKLAEQNLELEEYANRLTEVTQKNLQDLEETNKVITELSIILNAINESYVTKDDFNNLVSDFNRFKELVAKELKGGGKSSSLDKMSSSKIAKLARKYYDKKYYTKAIEYYEKLIERNYKPARAHFMIGEMNYYRKNYANAIAYFKKSASLYKDASYMPTLMLHTAVSMQKTGDIKRAKSFYKGIIAKYPNTTYAKTAKSKLNNL
jgi:TolA-binding protein